MEWINILQNFAIFVNLILISFMYIKFIRSKRCELAIKFLNKNLDLLYEVYRKQYSNDLKKMVELYSEIQTILKISESSSISLFRYNYAKSYIILQFMFCVNKNGEIQHQSFMDKLPATSNMLNLEILKSDSNNLHNLKTEIIKDVDMKAYQLLKHRGVEKIYFRNIRKNESSPLGYVVFSYQNDYEIDDSQREEIMRITTKISELL